MDSCPALSPDEYRLYFASNRPGGCGGADFYVSRRQDRKDDLAWGPPVNLGCAADGHLNSPSNEFTPAIFEDETGTEVVYFSSDRPGSASYDIYASRMKDDDTFGPATPVAELNSSFVDQGIAVRRDGLEVIFGSNRTGTLGDVDLWSATRESTADPWSAPVHLSNLMNSLSTDGGKMSLSFDGRMLYFRSNRAWGRPMNFVATFGSGDLYVLIRDNVRGQK